MVLKFRLISDEQDDFVRDFEILAEQTFFKLHMAIQENLHYDKSQIASFFICSENWEKEQEISLFELTEEESACVLTMENTIIKDHMFELHDKMIYVFDVFNERMFFIELFEKLEKEPSIKYPNCSLEEGRHTPQQLIMDQLFGANSISDGSMIEDFSYGYDYPDLSELDDLDYDSQILDDEIPNGY